MAVEVKLSDTVSAGDINSLLFLKDINSRFAAGLVVYAGKEVKQLTSNIFAVPWDML